jgi:hypothetical protein
MEYKVIERLSAQELNMEVNSRILQGWKPVGSHHVTVKRIQNRFRGTQHMDSVYELQYSQTVIKTK